MKTLILGASINPDRTSFLAASYLSRAGIDFVPVGLKKGVIFGKEILDIRTKPEVDGVHTLTLYLGPKNQPDYYDYILDINPQRIIFNPGTENEELRKLAEAKGINTEYSCTLTLLSIGIY